MINNLTRYFNTDGTPTVEGIRLFRTIFAGLGGGGGGATNLTYTAASRLLESSTGTDVTLPLVGSDPGLMSAADKTKLDGIASGANNYSHPNHSGDVTSVGDGATTIAADVVTNAKLANMAQSTIKGRAVGAGTGDPTDLTAAQATAILDTFTTSLKGLAPASGGGTSNFLRADGTWAAPGGPSWTLTQQAASATVNNSTTFQNSDLTFSVAANTWYRFRGLAFIQTGATADAKYQFTGPASPSVLNIKTASIANAATAFGNIRVETAFSQSRAATGTAAGVVFVEFDGILLNGANAGSVMFQWGQNSLEAVDTILRRGSYIEWAAA